MPRAHEVLVCVRRAVLASTAVLGCSASQIFSDAARRQRRARAVPLAYRWFVLAKQALCAFRRNYGFGAFAGSLLSGWTRLNITADILAFIRVRASGTRQALGIPASYVILEGTRGARLAYVICAATSCWHWASCAAGARTATLGLLAF